METGHATRMLEDATILMRIPLPPNVEAEGRPRDRERCTVTARHPDDAEHAGARPGAHARRPSADASSRRRSGRSTITRRPRACRDRELDLIAKFQLTTRSSARPRSRLFALGGPRRGCPRAARPPKSAAASSSRTCRRTSVNRRLQGRLVRRVPQRADDESDQPVPARAVPPGTRFQTVLVSEFNAAGTR